MGFYQFWHPMVNEPGNAYHPLQSYESKEQSNRNYNIALGTDYVSKQQSSFSKNPLETMNKLMNNNREPIFNFNLALNYSSSLRNKKDFNYHPNEP